MDKIHLTEYRSPDGETWHWCRLPHARLGALLVRDGSYPDCELMF